MSSSVSSLAIPGIIAAFFVARIYLRRRSARSKEIGAVPPGRKIVVLNLIERNR